MTTLEMFQVISDKLRTVEIGARNARAKCLLAYLVVTEENLNA